jgi:hypothetical protein
MPYQVSMLRDIEHPGCLRSSSSDVHFAINGTGRAQRGGYDKIYERI